MKLLELRVTMLLLFLLISILQSIIGGRNYARKIEKRNRIFSMHRRLSNRDEIGHKVCFELLGCFANRQQPLSLKRPPQDPSIISTRFFLYTRNNRYEPSEIEYGDKLQSMNQSNFNTTKKLKVIIHGYKGNGNTEEAIIGVHSFLDLDDFNVLVVDWAKGAGTTYGLAVSNTELVGRQLSLILLDAIELGIDPNNIHLVGFSLGAHVAGCASEVLKKRNVLLGRITGLDPASPFFRHHLFREKSRKLDSSDAKLVDVIHSDGSVDFADGFGLLKPIGHVDFFPNGGRQQPGCNDVKNSVVVSHLNEDSLDIHIACSHARSWFLFVESLKSQLSKCKFQTWPCKRRFGSYVAGTCFPQEDLIVAPEMGYAADKGPIGLYYLTTRAEPPYCGYPLRAAIRISENDFIPKGILWMKLINRNSEITFTIKCDQVSLSPLSSLNNRNNAQPIFYDIKATEFETFFVNTSSIMASLKFEVIISNEKPEFFNLKFLLLDKIFVEDRKGNRWEYCKNNTEIGPNEILLDLINRNC